VRGHPPPLPTRTISEDDVATFRSHYATSTFQSKRNNLHLISVPQPIRSKQNQARHTEREFLFFGLEAIEGFTAIGQDIVAEIIQEACSLFGEPFPRERSLRQSKLEAIDSELLDSLDQKFYGIIRSENGEFEAAADSYATRVGKLAQS
jgi:hypothetical protein